MDYLFLGVGVTSNNINCNGTFNCFLPFQCPNPFFCNIFNRITTCPNQGGGGGCPSNASGSIPLGNDLNG